MSSARVHRDIKPPNVIERPARDGVIVVRRTRDASRNGRKLLELLVDLLDKPDSP